jgi:tRNA threonylcarbamoyladenosine biosynthesis protein TsaE
VRTIISHSPEETQDIGKDFSKVLKPGSITAFYGELGSGKTQLIKGICKGLGVKEVVNSPTFIIVNEYISPLLGKICHFDLFRIKSSDELIDIGFDDYLNSNAILLIEWPELIENILPPEVNKIFISHRDSIENEREIKILNSTFVEEVKR